MNFFSKLFRNSTEREFKRKFQEIQRDVKQLTRPLANISTAIVTAADYCSKEMKPFIDAHDQERRQDLEIHLFYEFIYFFMHMTMRSSFAVLSEPQIKKL